MERIMKKPELVDEISARTGFYKKNMKEVVDALADIVIEQLQTATFEEDSEFHISPGILICGRRKPEQESIDPRDRSVVTTPEKIVPYAVFKQTARLKLYKTPKGYKKKKTKKV